MLWLWSKKDLLGIVRELRWTYLPPMMVYFAAGVSGFTGIIETFFVKDELGLTPAFLAGLGFWAGLPWALKMPLGHMVDLFWNRKAFFVYLGASLMAASLLIMVGLTGYKEWMSTILPANIWYIISVILAPVGFMMQDVVADAMTVEAVPTQNSNGDPIAESEIKRMHVTVQTLGRIAIVGGGALVAGLGGWIAKTTSYVVMYWISLVIPLISIFGVALGTVQKKWRQKELSYRKSNNREKIKTHSLATHPHAKPNWHILGGSAVFVIIALFLGISDILLKQEIIFIGSLLIVAYLIKNLLQDLAPAKRFEIVSIAIIIFIFRALPTPGAGSGWWQIDVLGFDDAFFGTLRQISALLAIVGMISLRGWMGRRPISYIIVFLSIYNTAMMLPFVGMYYGLHLWTETVFGFGAKTIAIVDTMADSPLGQVAMIPMLAWIAREAPENQKATYFAVMAAFTNLALSASQLGTQYLNKIFIIERGQYSELGMLFITIALINLCLPIIAVLIFNPKRQLKPTE